MQTRFFSRFLSRTCKRAALVQHTRRTARRTFAASKVLHRENIIRNVIEAQYAVRGAIVIRANAIQDELRAGNPNKLPFEKVIMCNIGNPQEVGQVPLTWHRQVLAGCLCPELRQKNVFPSDVNERIDAIVSNTSSYTIGAYTHSQGYPNVRRTVAKFISDRDGYEETDINNIFLTDGASPGIKYVLQAVIGGPEHGALLPIPQYPLYSASVALLGGTQVDYYLNEEKGWAFSIDDAERAVKEAKAAGVQPRVLVVINPGNPVGTVTTEADIRAAIELAKKENLVILADEVYQENVYDPERPFVSFRKVLKSMGSAYDEVELASFHSVSKGILGECGLRGGYMHLTNIDESGREQLYKLVSVNLCPNTVGQITVDLMCGRPQKGDPSHELFAKEYDTQYQSLKRRAAVLSTELNKINGISCQSVNGAMYAFPQITLSGRACEEAARRGIAPDALYCMDLLESTGICTVPGSGFGQREGTYHFRTTLLPPEEEMKQVVQKVGQFHKEFTHKWA